MRLALLPEISPPALGDTWLPLTGYGALSVRSYIQQGYSKFDVYIVGGGGPGGAGAMETASGGTVMGGGGGGGGGAMGFIVQGYLATLPGSVDYRVGRGGFVGEAAGQQSIFNNWVANGGGSGGKGSPTNYGGGGGGGSGTGNGSGPKGADGTTAGAAGGNPLIAPVNSPYGAKGGRGSAGTSAGPATGLDGDPGGDGYNAIKLFGGGGGGGGHGVSAGHAALLTIGASGGAGYHCSGAAPTHSVGDGYNGYGGAGGGGGGGINLTFLSTLPGFSGNAIDINGGPIGPGSGGNGGMGYSDYWAGDPNHYALTVAATKGADGLILIRLYV